MEITWRELLGKIVSDSQEQQRIIDALGINAMTLRRWINGDTNPRPQNLRMLLNVLPRQRRVMLSLLAQEFPTFEREAVPYIQQEPIISADFYAQIMSTYVSTAQYIRSFTMCDMLLSELIKQLDPDQDGMLVYVAQCVPPRPGERVRSLRIIAGRGTAPWSTYVEYHQQFFGAESPVGHAVSAGHQTQIRDRFEGQRIFPDSVIEDVESFVTAPIVHGNKVVGGLYVASTRSDHFVPVYVTLIQRYVDIFCLAFESDEFYDLASIELGIMPPREQQLPFLETFQERVTRQIMLAAQAQSPIKRLQAEKIAWQEIEEELLNATYTSLPPDTSNQTY